MKWNDSLNTLPDAGKTVICYGKNTYGKDRTLRAFYAPRFTIEDTNEYEAAEYSEEQDQNYLKEGWYECNEHEEVNWMIEFPVTHWMPLPKPTFNNQSA